MLSKKSFIGVVRGGYVLQESFDEEDNCEIIYEIRSKGLKSRTGIGIKWKNCCHYPGESLLFKI